MRRIFLFGAIIVVSACHSAQKAAEHVVSQDLPDPGSARFRNFHINNEGVVCGEVNGKDRKGAYSGFRKFVYYSHTGNHHLEPEDISAQFEDAMSVCRASYGTGVVVDACQEAEKLAPAQRILTEFRDRYTIDCR
ncbi:hypothetical protein KC8_06405 [Sphingomonas sp. KC8]|nr:hypothetical protein KC8_06405 [Sphingomonas sp. KC8]